jgi:zinc protease
VFAQTGKTNLNEQLPVDPKVKIGKLDNGLVYYIRKMLNRKKELNYV